MNLKNRLSALMLLLGTSSAFAQHQPQVQLSAVQLETGKAQPVYELSPEVTTKKSHWNNYIYIQPDVTFQAIEGIGGAFNEIGGEALLSLKKKEQKAVMENLFAKDQAGFTFCRTAIGASDFGIDAYSYSMTPEDYDQKHFSIKRDKKYVLPYIKSAFDINPELTLFASPWSPPGWMKVSGKMEGLQKEGNALRDTPAIYKAYAKYFVKYIQAYEKEGVRVDRICIQNENDADTKYPSCQFPAKDMVKFAHDYLAPAFKQNKIDSKIYAGTFRAANQMDLMDFTQSKYLKAVEGVGIQYTESKIISDARAVLPGLKIFHTEGHCYNGKNSSEQAKHRLEEVASYLNSGSTTFTYWNMILNETTKSGWDWNQNSLININRTTGEVQYNPDYNAMYIISKYIKPGDVRVASVNRANQHPLITVKSPEGQVKVLIQNTHEQEEVFTFVMGDQEIKAQLPAQAISAIVINPAKNL
ncbi:hypothetical protein [Persicobacter diffluens]|uniref:Glycosyl hydrolase n=1 Tax=Persicobacter diffluens TaxID=981 RepID=A0AAN4W2U2_9BACT|nr:glycosyl hydrolase [Persicobacter diffluens]